MTPARRGFAWAALGVAAFTVYGSLVPFHFRGRAFGDALDEFAATFAAGPKLVSRSDALANLLLGVPLGFALLGLACADRGCARARAARAGLVLLPLCALFAAGVEFAQLFTAARTCSASDVLAQTFGAALGMLAWVFRGQALTDAARAVWTRADVNAAGRVLIGYVALVALVQTLPFDVTASPADLYRKFRDGGVKFAPFGEFDGADDARRWELIGKLVKLAGLFFPLGLLAARLKGRTEHWGLVPVALAALALAVLLEAPQLVVRSRTPSATDVLVAALAALGGWYAGRVHHEGLALPFAASWAVVWFAALTAVTQPPAGATPRDAPRPFDWVPGLPLESGDPLHALEEMLVKLVLFGLLGVIVAAWRLPPRSRRAPHGSVPVALGAAAALGQLAAAFFENGQRWHDTHTPCITDVLLGGAGAVLGVLVASRTTSAPVSRKP
ncbi:MAG: VanZ family protein [Planctomycetes bacterium]|nr:VanZ family protein [Planctomycetota bacterium]